MRLDQYMAQYWPELSRSTWQKYIEMGLVEVNGDVQTSVRYQLDEDDQVSHQDLPTVDSTAMSLPIIYENDHVLVINKPVGVLTHSKGEIQEEFTVADFVLSHMTIPETTNRPGIVHRLDRDTSGVIIAAKDTDSKRFLQKQFQDRKAKKVYHAIVKGVPKLPEANIDLPIGRYPKKPSTFRVDPNGKDAFTHYKLISSTGKRSLLELRPTTGRTHQLRVHLAHIGTPILGDRFYGASKKDDQRLMLHASELEITVPGGTRLTFKAPLPDDFNEVLGQ